MDGGSNQILSRTGLTEDKDGCVHGSDLFRSIENVLETIDLPDNLPKVMFHFGLVTEVNILALQLVFHCFDFSKGRPELNRPLLYLPFEIVVGFLQCLLYFPALGDVANYDAVYVNSVCVLLHVGLK